MLTAGVIFSSRYLKDNWGDMLVLGRFRGSVLLGECDLCMLGEGNNVVLNPANAGASVFNSVVLHSSPELVLHCNHCDVLHSSSTHVVVLHLLTSISCVIIIMLCCRTLIIIGSVVVHSSPQLVV